MLVFASQSLAECNSEMISNMMFCGWTIIMVLVLGLAYANAADTQSVDKTRELLLKRLLANYQPSSRPGRLNETLVLFVDIELQHFDYREREGAFHMVGLMHVRWRDPKLVWNSRDFGNMSHITISQRQIWVPDLEFYNNSPNKFIRMYRYGFVTVKNDGVVFWTDTVDVSTFCSSQMKNWPHDKHECQISLGSWVFDGLEVDIRHISPNTSMSLSNANRTSTKYKVTQYFGTHNAKYYSCCPQPYITLDYNITFERESTYAVIFRMPALSVIMFTLLALNMEPQRVEKFWLNAVSLWLICGHLLYFAVNSHNFNQETTNVVEFFKMSLVVVTLSQIVAVFSVYASCGMFRPHLSSRISRFVNASWTHHLVAKIETKNSDKPRDNMTRDFIEEKSDDVAGLLGQQMPLNDWHRLAKLLQRIIMICFACYFIILATVCFV